MEIRKAKSILYVCEGNACRSIIAEALTNYYWKDLIHPNSAGLRPLGIIPEETLLVLKEWGIPTGTLYSKGLGDIALSPFQVIINLSLESVEEHLPEHFVGRVINWYVRDPYRGSLQSFRQARDAIDWFVTEKLPGILL